MPTDPFCSEEAISRTRYFRSSFFYVLYDINPVLPGHSLIVPKRHVPDFVLLEKDELLDLHAVARKVIPKLVETYGQEGSYNFTAQIGVYSGHHLDHLHFHVLPRSKNDMFQHGERIYDHIGTASKAAAGNVGKEVARLREIFKYEG